MLQDKKTDPKFPTQNAFVNYQDPKSACRALRRRHHRLNRRTVRVQAADSWHQPEPHTALPPVVSTDSWFRLYRENFTGYTEHDSESDELLEEDEDYAPVKSYRRIKKKKTKGKNNQVATTTATAVVEDKGTNILALNNDCLDMICSWLQPNEQVRFARTCTRFADIFATRCKHEYKTMDLEKFNYMTVWEMRDFLYYTGNYIEEIVNPIPNLQHEKILQLINKHCPNLQTATLTESALTPIQFKDLLRNAPQLKELQLRNSKLKKCWTKALVHASQLERLTFPRDTKYKAESLNSFMHLKELSVASCIVSAEELLKSYDVLQNLHTLDLRFVEGLESAFYNLLEGLCPQLETLKMTCPSHPYERVALLPRLNHLELVVDFLSDAEISVAMLEYLVEHKADQLSVLKYMPKSH
ncbi:unnamed protein product [Ceratitis capitata]|uniref:(Mediterranean fruit fly) hypothetical protein n=1 Tax=Ceratitis capitata TaxID=7213 RepID=A0A811VAB6_CERCA|nr:unnamed protein product [Ceratitis capitata]